MNRSHRTFECDMPDCGKRDVVEVGDTFAAENFLINWGWTVIRRPHMGYYDVNEHYCPDHAEPELQAELRDRLERYVASHERVTDTQNRRHPYARRADH